MGREPHVSRDHDRRVAVIVSGLAPFVAVLDRGRLIHCRTDRFISRGIDQIMFRPTP